MHGSGPPLIPWFLERLVPIDSRLSVFPAYQMCRRPHPWFQPPASTCCHCCDSGTYLFHPSTVAPWLTALSGCLLIIPHSVPAPASRRWCYGQRLRIIMCFETRAEQTDSLVGEARLYGSTSSHGDDGSLMDHGTDSPAARGLPKTLLYRDGFKASTRCV